MGMDTEERKEKRVRKEHKIDKDQRNRAPVEREEQTEITRVEPQYSGFWLANHFIYFIFGILILLLFFRLFLVLVGANPDNGFVQFIYTTTSIFVAPFFNIFPGEVIPTEGTAGLELATLMAIAVYAALAWVILKLIDMLATASRTP